MADEQFWGKDMTTLHDSGGSWFAALSMRRKVVFALLLLFVAAWCFLIGFRVAFDRGVSAWSEDFEMVTGKDLNDEVYTVQQLEGLRTILIVGCDTREDANWGNGRSDTMILAFLNLTDKSVNLLSIPRDSYVQIPGYGKNKINAAFSQGGVSMAKETVEYLLGIEIDDYVVVDFNGFVELVDALGGVEINVESTMSNWNEGIDIYPGLQTLDGHDALGYVRYRGADVSDYDRISHQQQFIQAVLDKLLSFSSVTKIAQLVGIALNNVQTDLKAIDALELAKYGLTMDLDNMQVHTIEGYSKWIEMGGMYVVCEIIYKDRLISTLNAIAGEGFTFAPNVIDDGGLGYYSLPEGADAEETDGDAPGNPDETADPNAGQNIDGEGTGTAEPSTEPNTDPGTDPNSGAPQLNDPVSAPDGGQGTDVWDLPNPDQ